MNMIMAFHNCYASYMVYIEDIQVRNNRPSYNGDQI